MNRAARGCVVCGQTFKPQKKDQWACSGDCAAKLEKIAETARRGASQELEEIQDTSEVELFRAAAPPADSIDIYYTAIGALSQLAECALNTDDKIDRAQLVQMMKRHIFLAEESTKT